MRIWDVSPARLCRQHLLGEHRELHGLWNILVLGHRGYAAHPETRRWIGKLPALRARHEQLVAEMARRGYSHRSPLDDAPIAGASEQDVLLLSVPDQLSLLRAKPCACPLPGDDAEPDAPGARASDDPPRT